MKQHPLTKPLRQPCHSKEASPKSAPFGKIEKRLLLTNDGQPTLAAVCKHLWPDLQKVRKWIPSTARQYSSTMIKYVLPYFSKVSFTDLDEDDILGAWANFLLKAPSHSTIQTASTVIRALMELAYERGLTRTTLWGLPLDDSLPSSPISDQEDIDEQEGKTFAERLRVPKTISLEKEIALVQALLDLCHEHGEAIACLAMVWGGTRTSEATGLSYNSLTEVSAGYWALIRYEVSDKDSRDTHDGGKTSNSYRLLPIPPILAQLLLERKAQFQHAHPHADVDNAPLACKGTDLTKRCTQKEVNQVRLPSGRCCREPGCSGIPGHRRRSRARGGVRAPRNGLSLPSPIRHLCLILRPDSRRNLRPDGSCHHRWPDSKIRLLQSGSVQKACRQALPAPADAGLHELSRSPPVYIQRDSADSHR